jgi:TrmH family RNA methyltransferase
LEYLESMVLSKGKAQLLERLRNSRLRPREAQYIVEGIRGAAEVLAGELTQEVRFALVSPRLLTSEAGRGLWEKLEKADIPLTEVSDPDLEARSDTEHPQGVLLVVREPRDPLGTLSGSEAPRILLLDGIQDPGNAGTLIRAAQAFGIDGVFALDGTVDPFNPKVVRASAGALSHIPVCRSSCDAVLAWIRERELPLLVGDPEGADVRHVVVPPCWALAVGNEGAGVRGILLEEAEQMLAIPMEQGADSLNAGLAGAILLFALTPSLGMDNHERAKDYREN